jgi:hypothetical protein
LRATVIAHAVGSSFENRNFGHTSLWGDAVIRVLLFVLIAVGLARAEAKPVTVKSVAQTESGRNVVKASNGHYYIELRSAEIEPATAEDIYARYQAEIHEALFEDSPGGRPSRPMRVHHKCGKRCRKRQSAAVREVKTAPGIESEGLRLTGQKGLIGFSLPALAKVEGMKYRYSRTGVFDGGDRGMLYEDYSMVETPETEGALVTAGCRNPQGNLDQNDPLNANLVSCFAGLMVFVRLDHR